MPDERHGSHEDFARDHKVDGSTNRTFGLVFAGFFALIGLLPLIHGGAMRLWALALALVLAIVAALRPELLRPLNRLWTQFGLLLHKVVSPIVMALLFFGTVTPIGLLMRLMGKDPLRLKPDPAAASYWIDRVPPGPDAQSIKNQF